MMRVLVVGANGALGREIIKLLGPKGGIAVTRQSQFEDSRFDHFQLGGDQRLPAEALQQANAIINAAGRVHAAPNELHAANVELPRMLAVQAARAGFGKFVQVSSFSVYGDAEHIDASTAIDPVTEYGRSKALGDSELIQLSDVGFAVEAIRLPLLFSEEKPALVGKLLQATRRMPAWPVASQPARRSMITYKAAAQVLVAAAMGEKSGVSHAADTQLFDFELLARLLREEAGHRLRLIKLPPPLVTALGTLSPSLRRRLFQSSTLGISSNVAPCDFADSGIEPTIRAILRNGLAR